MILNIAAILAFSATGESTALLQVTHGAEQPYTQTRPGEEVPLRFSEPYEIVVADLENYIPRRLREADVPGLAIALIHNKRVVWSAGFGLANKITGRAVTPETVFEAASISKVVTT